MSHPKKNRALIISVIVVSILVVLGATAYLLYHFVFDAPASSSPDTLSVLVQYPTVFPYTPDPTQEGESMGTLTGGGYTLDVIGASVDTIQKNVSAHLVTNTHPMAAANGLLYPHGTVWTTQIVAAGTTSPAPLQVYGVWMTVVVTSSPGGVDTSTFPSVVPPLFLQFPVVQPGGSMQYKSPATFTGFATS